MIRIVIVYYTQILKIKIKGEIQMRKMLSIVIVTIFIALLITPVTANACGSHHGGKGTRTSSYSVCSIEDCTLTNFHTHNGTTYSAHYYGDGHEYHDYCEIEDCILVGYHLHDGAYCFSHTLNDGHEYHDYCGIANCTLTGYHEHDGTYCFGHSLNDGHSYHRSGRGCR